MDSAGRRRHCPWSSCGRPVHLLFITPAFPPFTGGGERYARSLALTLAGRGHQLTVVTSHARAEQEFWQGRAGALALEVDGPLRVLRCPLRPFPGGRVGLLAWRKAMVLLSALPGDQARILQGMARLIPPIAGLERALRQCPHDVSLVHGFNISWEYPLVVARRFAQRRRLPFVVTPFAHFGEGAKGRVARNSTMDHQRRLLDEADAVLALTRIEQEGVASWGLRTPYVEVVGAGVDPAPSLSDPERVLVRHALQEPFALFVGRINYDKGAIHAAQAVTALRRQGTPLTLALVGRTAPEFERYYGQLDAPERQGIRLLGSIGDSEKHALLQQTIALLLPSRTDSFGIVLLEAWLHGTPVIGARAGGIRSVVDHETNGLLVPFGDVEGLAEALQRLLADEALRQRMGRQGQEKVRREYTWDRVGERVLAAYRHVVEPSSS